MTPNNCAVCEGLTIRSTSRKHTSLEVEYRLWECDDCGVQFWTPFKNPGADWYGKDERYAGRNIDPILDANWNHRKVISYLAPFTGRVLDVGCGIGNFLAYAKTRGWTVRGIDFDHDAIRAAQRTFGLTGLETKDIRGFRRAHSNERFDLVTFFDVLEHVDNHREFMTDVKGLVNEGGYIAMSMPYRKGAMWLMPHDLPPRHLTRWDRTSLSAFLRREGFEPVYMTRRSEGVRFVILKLRFRYGKFLSFNVVGKAKALARREESVVMPGSRIERKIKLLERLAAVKDALIFGLPALIIWTVMMPTSQRYVTLYCIARKRTE